MINWDKYRDHLRRTNLWQKFNLCSTTIVIRWSTFFTSDMLLNKMKEKSFFFTLVQGYYDYWYNYHNNIF